MKNTKNIIILALAVLVILFSIYEISNIYSKSNLVSDKSVEAKKELDIYALGYKTDDNNGTKTEITKRIGDFYCKVQEFYDTKTKEVDMGNYFCAKIGGPIVSGSSSVPDCVLVLNTGVPKGLDVNLDSCFYLK